MDKQQILQQCTISGNIVKLPEIQLDRKLYQEVAKALELIGGKWKGGKTAGFVFQEDPTELLEQIANGENRNIKKEYQFFATPSDIADWLVELAQIKSDDIILEPSAGQGAIIEAILRTNPQASVFAIELMDTNSIILNRKGFNHEKGDFLAIPNQPVYDKIIANPPFSKNQDIDHIRRMYDLLKFGGRIVSVASKHWQFASGKKETEFRYWLSNMGATVHEISEGSFKDSGTMVASCIIIIDK
ncbi:MAG: hypothetical protein A2X18_07535 [Bacteroidetes bacterium GWF2_40_14]|nr:MAG: hypothetical protein A2X18_07535 [Bacteroidetes bacterium GWF2_40_14]